jgi:hypothetical protein
VLASAYGFLQGAWPFGIIEANWAGVAVRRWRTRTLTVNIGHPSADNHLRTCSRLSPKSATREAERLSGLETTSSNFVGSSSFGTTLYAFHIRRKRALMSIGSLGGICSFAGTAATGHAHP